MSGSGHDALRLVPLVATFERLTNPALDISRVLDLAVNGEVCLYVQVPPNKLAYVDHFISVSTNPSWFFRIRIPDWGLSFYSPGSGLIDPKITYVALYRDEAEKLKERGITDDVVFPFGLSPHPDKSMAAAEWLVPRQFDASLVICPASLTTVADKKRGGVRRTVLKATLADIHVDRDVIRLLDGSRPTLHDDPYLLGDRSPGMYALYRAASRYHGELKAKTIDIQTVQVDVKERLQDQAKVYRDALKAKATGHEAGGLGSIELLRNARRIRDIGESYINLAVQLISPPQRRRKGHEPSDKGILEHRKYMQQTFVTEALALAFFVTEGWLAVRKNSTTGQSHTYLQENFERVGFSKKKQDALVHMAMWPEI